MDQCRSDKIFFLRFLGLAETRRRKIFCTKVAAGQAANERLNPEAINYLHL
jgi:hypothetical protein